MTTEHSSIARFLLLTAAFVVVVAGMKAATPILVPFLLSLFIAVVCSPLLIWLHRHRVPNGMAIVVVIVMIVVVGMLIASVMGSSIQSFQQDLPLYQQRLQEMSGGLQQRLAAKGLEIGSEQWSSVFDPGAVLTMASKIVASFGNMMTNAFLILLTVIFILAEEVGFSEKLRSSSSDSARTLQGIERFTASVNQYMAIKTLLSLVTAVLIMLWLWVLGVDYIVLWGLLAFLLNFIPNLGSILAALPVVLLALVQLGPMTAILTALGYLLVNVVIGNAIEPRFMGKGLDLSALVVFLSLVFWGWVLGSVGMLLSVPLTMTVKIALESSDDTRWLGVMLGSGRSAKQA